MEVSLESFKKRFTYDPQLDLLGKGGFGEVYKAYDNEDKCYVALKIYTGSADSKYTLINEVKRFKKFRHPNIIEHIEAYEVTTGSNDIHGKPIIYQIAILEYADGGTLADLMKKGITDKHLLEDLAKDILEGLSYLHRNNIIHRDLKPSNILLYKEGDKLRAKITDFGIAKQTDVTSQSTQLVGTVEYMAPEFFTNSANLTPAADIWSFGVILLEAVTGIHAFKTSTGSPSEQVIHNILATDLHDSLQSVPIPFKEVIIRSLVRDPAMRSTADVLIRLLSNEAGDNFSERTQVIQRKTKENPPNPEIKLSGLFDFNFQKGRWKKIVAREFILMLMLLLLIITSSIFFSLVSWKLDEFFVSKSIKEEEFFANRLDSLKQYKYDKFTLQTLADFYATLYTKPYLKDSPQILLNKFPEFKNDLRILNKALICYSSDIGSLKFPSGYVPLPSSNIKLPNILMEEDELSIFSKIEVANNKIHLTGYSIDQMYTCMKAMGCILLLIFYPIRLFIGIILWSLKTMGIQIDLPVLNAKSRKRIKLIGVLLLIMAGLIFLGKVGYEKWNVHKQSGLAERLNKLLEGSKEIKVNEYGDTTSSGLPIFPKGYTEIKDTPKSKPRFDPNQPYQTARAIPKPSKQENSYPSQKSQNKESLTSSSTTPPPPLQWVYYYSIYDGYATSVPLGRERWANLSKVHMVLSQYWNEDNRTKKQRCIEDRLNNQSVRSDDHFNVYVYVFNNSEEAYSAWSQSKAEIANVHQAFFAIDDYCP